MLFARPHCIILNKALKIEYQLHVQQARCKPIGHRIYLLAALIPYPSVRKGILYAQQVEYLQAAPNVLYVVEEAMGMEVFLAPVEQQGGEAYVYTFIVWYAQYVLVQVSARRSYGQSAGVQQVYMRLEVLIAAQIVFKVHAQHKALICRHREVVVVPGYGWAVCYLLLCLEHAYAYPGGGILHKIAI